MPLIDPNYLRQAAMARVNQGLLPAVNDEDYAAMLERLRQDYGIGPTDSVDGGEIGNILDTQAPAEPSGLLDQGNLDQGAADKLNVGLRPAVPVMGRGPRPPGAEVERKYLMEDKWQPPVTDAQDWVSGQFDKIPAIASDTVAKMMPGPVSQIPYLNQLTSPLSMVQGMAEQGAQLTDTGTEIARGQQITHPALAAFNAITMAPIPGARVAKEAEQGVQAAKPFFSMLRQAVEAAPFSKAPGKQWLGRVQNSPGVKLDELDWTGFKKWAEATPLATKEEALAHLDDNAIDVQEVMKGNPGVQIVEKYGRHALVDPEGQPIRSSSGNLMEYYDRADAERAAKAFNRDYEGTPKFSQWQLPGGENYREMVLTLPQKNKGTYGQFTDRIQEKYGDEWFSKMTANERATLDRLNIAQDKDQPAFQSGHYDEPNVLAHMRFNDRVDANGKKTLFIEEIQSDWHQRGRKSGYANPKVSEAIARLKANKQTPEDLELLNREMPEGVGTREYSDSRVPDAPFKKDWHELALKRAIKYAADNGYDQIAWTPGAVQAERYDLSKQVKKLRVYKRADGEGYNVNGTMTNGDPLQHHAKDAAALADTIGKEHADKALKQIEEGGAGAFANFEGEDLKIGGEGMKGFYDKMLPDAANKIGKKYGARVGTTKIKTGTKTYDDPDMGDLVPENEEQAALLRGHAKIVPHDQDVWTLPITPALKEQAIKKGFPVSALEDLTRAVG